jgi:hypothetical protein
MPFKPVSFTTVLEEELKELKARRAALATPDAVPETEPAAAPPLPPVSDQHEAERVLHLAHAFGAFGVGLSGGGIRSATFNLGILQGLSQRNLLPYIDYLSTVSGGGYIGTWLHSVIRRKHGGNPVLAGGALNRPVPGPAKDDPVTFLRKYSNYLAPRWNLLSADAWVIGCIWLRNMFLNQLILVPFLAALVALALLIRDGFRSVSNNLDGFEAKLVVLAGFAALGLGVIWAVRSLRRVSGRERPTDGKWPSPWPTILGVLGFGWFLFPVHPAGLHHPLFECVVFTLLFFLHQYAGGFKDCFLKQRASEPQGVVPRLIFHLIWMPAVSGLATTALLEGAASKYLIGMPGGSWQQVVWGPPLLTFVIYMGATLHIGLMGVDFPDESREWLARIAATGSLIGFGWMALVGLSVYGPYLVTSFAGKHGPAAAALLATWGGSILAGLLAANSAKTNGGTNRIGNSLLKIVPALLMVGILIFIAGVCHWALALGIPRPPVVAAKADSTIVAVTVIKPPDQSADVTIDTPQTYANWFAWAHTFAEQDLTVLRQSIAATGDLRLMTPSELLHLVEGRVWLLFLGCCALAGLLPLRFNVNEFSMHHFYKNRLVRCYPGAGNAKDRRPNPFTGFDPKDDLLLERLRARYRNPEKPTEPRYLGPYPIVNTTLNLNAGSELATQERKANSFVFTPLYCGFIPTGDSTNEVRYAKDGYIRTTGFYNDGGPRIGTAMAISGAAANPNWGYHTSAPVAFLLTMFNVRLGWWVGNTRVVPTGSPFEPKLPWRRPGPRYSLFWLLWELLGQTTDHSAYVNLSDGGHFENLGLYELVRRRCRYIVIGDGEQDGDYTFESLGGAIRKCRADFGVEIDIDIEQIRSKEAAKRTHCVVGTIKYPEKRRHGRAAIAKAGAGNDTVRATDLQHRGWILYLKSSLTGDEPEDVKQYKDSHPDFPQESTMNQFFTESQFESYRRLGLHVVETVFKDVEDKAIPDGAKDRRQTLDAVFQRLAALWYGEPALAAGVATSLNKQYSDLVERLSKDPDLRFLDTTFLSNGTPAPVPAGRDPEVQRKAFFFIVDMIQVMENAWFDLALDKEANRNHPKFQGWMRTFGLWKDAPLFEDAWGKVRKNYNPLFQYFVDKLEKPKRRPGPTP